MWSALFWDFTQRRLVVSCRRFAKTVGGCEILKAVLVKIRDVKDISPFWLVKLPSYSGPTVQDALLSTETSATLHQPTGRNLCENVTSLRIEDRAGRQFTVYDASFLDLWRSLPHSQKPHTRHIFHSVHYDILKLWLTPPSAQFYSLCILSITCRS